MKYIVLIDDADHSGPLLRAQAHAQPGAQWVLLACAPRMTHRVSKWVSHSSREQWRQKWAEKLFFAVVPQLRGQSQRVDTVLVKGPAQEAVDAAMQVGTAQLLDFRKPRAPEGSERRSPWGTGDAKQGGQVHWGWLSGSMLTWLALAAE